MQSNSYQNKSHQSIGGYGMFNVRKAFTCTLCSRNRDSSEKATVQCCFTSTETIRTIRDGEPRTATSTFTQLLTSEKATLHRDLNTRQLPSLTYSRATTTPVCVAEPASSAEGSKLREFSQTTTTQLELAQDSESHCATASQNRKRTYIPQSVYVRLNLKC